MKLKALAMIALGASLLSTPDGQAEELRFAIGHPPASRLVQAGEKYAEVVAQETNGAVTVKVFPMSLLSMAETSGGIKDGLADIGALMTPYFPNEFPHTNMLMDASVLLRNKPESAGREAVIFNGAMSEYIFTKCPECNDEFKAQNQVFSGVGGSPEYILNCNKPVVTLADAQSAKIRIGGSTWARWAEFVGAAPITISGNEMLEALNQGIIDCVALSIPDLLNFGMGDSVTDITVSVPSGTFAAAYAQINADSWAGLSPEHRSAVMKAAAIGAAEISATYQMAHAEGLEELAAKGVNIHEPSADLVDKTMEFARGQTTDLAEHYSKEFNVQRAAEILAEFDVLLDKWTDLTNGVSSPEEVAELYWAEVFSKVDVTSHGM